jgi:DNA repair/transcription protein MET18/MMS19
MLTLGLSVAIGSSNSVPPLEQLIAMVIQTYVDNLANPDLKYVKHCGKLLMSAASSCSIACCMVMDGILEMTFKSYMDQETPSKKKIVMEVLVDIMTAARLTNSTKLKNYKDEILEIMTTALLTFTYAPLRKTAISGMFELIQYQSIMEPKELEICAGHLNTVALDSSTQESESAQGYLRQLSWVNSALVLQHSLPAFLSVVAANGQNFEAALHSLTQVSTSTYIFVEAISKLLEIFKAKCDENVLGAILSTVAARAEYECANADSRKLLAPLITELISPLINEMDISSKTALSTLGKIITTITRNVNAIEQEAICKLIVTRNLIPNSTSITPINGGMAYLYESCFCYIQSKTLHGISNVDDFLFDLITESVESKDPVFAISAAKIVGCFVNKTFDSSQSTAFVSRFNEVFTNYVVLNEACVTSDRSMLLKIYAWIAKALVMQSRPLGLEMGRVVLGFLNHPILLESATQSFEIIMKDDDVLSKKSIAKQGILYKQKFYNYCLPIISKGFNESEEKSHYLTALSHMLRNISNKFLLAELPTLFPMLIFSLQSKDTQLKLATLSTFEFMINNAPKLVSNQVPALLNVLFPMCSFTNKYDGNDAVTIINSSMFALPLVNSLACLQRHWTLQKHLL